MTNRLRIGHEAEAAFHDEWAEAADLWAIPVRESFESLLAPENRFIRRLMGDLHGRRVLDVGAGLGEASVYFALQGAQVTATDLSPKMIERACQLAEAHGTRISGVVCPAEQLRVDHATFDVCYAANLLHHVQHRGRVLSEMRRALRPGGLVVTWDPLAYNPVINIYRRMATKVRTVGERPLRFDILREYRRWFPDARHREFWLTSLSVFLKYYLVDRIHPNEDRYWKRILREDETAAGAWLRPLIMLDNFLLRVWPLNYVAWNTVIWGHRPARETALGLHAGAR
jgi:2-polyprenyl-3-methyl-5-hydroxy-6-metoxy-1,4-benzoquinol methylase